MQPEPMIAFCKQNNAFAAAEFSKVLVAVYAARRESTRLAAQGGDPVPAINRASDPLVGKLKPSTAMLSCYKPAKADSRAQRTLLCPARPR